ncbi:MAG: 2-oxoisovalerate dehydrogenase E1 component [Myxococcota bacterium]|jgi:2-oxoisovalerate dehydrogenase E1 component
MSTTAQTASRTHLDLPKLEVPDPTDAELAHAYRVGARSRAVEEHIVRLVTRGEVKFAIWGPGEEVHGIATALALKKAVDPAHFGVVAHYRSGALCSMWCELNGVEDFTLRMLRQQFSRATDAMSGGRQMVYHLNIPEVGILPVQSPVGMQLGKAAGYALGFKKKGITDAVTLGIVGDGTTAEGDMHDCMNAIAVWELPTIVMVTDNGVAISTTPDEGRGIRDFEAYAAGFGIKHFTCDGTDFLDVYRTTYACARYVRENQRGAMLHVRNLPRFNGHSSAADVTFDLGQGDPLITFGAVLVDRGVLGKADVMRRIEGSGRDFFAHHELGKVMVDEDEGLRAIIDQIRDEPHPDPATLFDHVYAPFPTDPETAPGPGTTNISYAGAIRSGLDKLIRRRNGFIAGQDVGRLGGVMTATAGLKALHPDSIVDSPLNEPLIVGTSTGLSLHPDLMALPEIQFGDYSLNAFHWLVYLGTVRWTNLGHASCKLLLRMPTDPFGGGAVYHSMSLDGYFCSIPGLVVVMPSTSFDVHGLLLSAGDYDGPVVCLEPKWMYRQTLGPAFPGEASERGEITEMKKRIMRGEVPDLPDVRVPFGKGVVRRAGTDVTVVAWGRAVWTAMKAADALAAEGVSIEVIDLRTLVPPDMELIYGSVGRTGRLIVAAEDRTFGGFVRQIQGDVVQKFPGLPTRAVGQKAVPGVAQSLVLEEATVLTASDIVSAATEVISVRVGGTGDWGWVPSRYFV